MDKNYMNENVGGHVPLYPNPEYNPYKQEQGYMNENAAVQVPLYPSPEYNAYKQEQGQGQEAPPPAYENPRIDFQSGWKDRGFAIAFWIHFVVVAAVGLILGVPALNAIRNHQGFKDMKVLPSNYDITPVFYGLGASIGVAVFASFATFFILQCCSGRLIRCSYVVIISLQSALILLIFLLVPIPISIGVAFIPIIILLIILIYICCVRKRVAFAEAHLKAGVAALHTHPSLLLIAILMIVIEIIWFVLWLLMVIGLQSLFTDSPLIPDLAPNAPNNQTTMGYRTTRTTYFYSTTSSSKFRSSFDGPNSSSATVTDGSSDGWTKMIIKIVLLFSWYWGMVTFSNIIHFVTACSVGQWWFTGGDDEQYRLGTSFRRAFTKNFGTIAFGSFFEALIKAVRSSADDRRGKSIFACFASCILSILEKIVGYINEWGFVYAALTGQGFVQSSRSIVDLFLARGFTMIVNDTLIGVTLAIINFSIGLVSAFAGGILVFLLAPASEEKIIIIAVVSMISFLLGLFMSSVITTVLKSCIRSVFVCFALNPAALAVSHPDHLENLNNVWHKLYPNEFVASGYAKNYAAPIAQSKTEQSTQ